MTRCVDHVEGVGLAVDLPGHANRLRLDCDASLALNIHAVEVLGSHRAVVDDTGELKHAVGEGRFSVVDVGNYAEIANHARVGLGWLKTAGGTWRQCKPRYLGKTTDFGTSIVA